LGCAIGGAVGFAVSRLWVFSLGDKPLRAQIMRYVMVSGTSLALNAGGVYVLMLLPSPDYRLAWLLVRGAVFLCWNYPLHRDFVFAAEKRGPEAQPFEPFGAERLVR
jgi:putative flippase GtrA